MKAKIIGYGASGKAAESLLTARHIETVVVADANENVSLDYDFCVVSPGVPSSLVANESVPVIPEIELPFYLEPRCKPRQLIAVTGTNGKTTVVNQIYQMCVNAGKPAVLAGNVGTPVSRVATQLPGSFAVLEVSSFMLEQAKMLHPQIAVLTNITTDHLDRHQTMAEYIRCKAKIAAQQTRRDVIIVNWDDLNARQVGQAIQKAHHSQVIWYSLTERVKGYYCNAGWVIEWFGGRPRPLMPTDPLGGMAHSLSNALAVIAVGRRLRLKMPPILAAVRYQARPHRLELVADAQGVAFYNDSKATNIAATLAAVQAFTLPVNLILCGLGKGQDYHELLSQLPTNVQQIFVFGAIKQTVMAVAQELQMTNVIAVADMPQAVNRAWQTVVRPGVVLLSPSGSSFDQFSNYEQRGTVFRTLVQQITTPTTQCSHPVDVDL